METIELRTRLDRIEELLRPLALGIAVLECTLEEVKAEVGIAEPIQFYEDEDEEKTKQLSDMVLDVQVYIDWYHMRDITLEEISKKCKLSREHFSRKFKKEMGVGFIDYLNEYRIKKAKEYLKTTRNSICNIAGKSGFNNPNHFTKIFKKFEGCTPTEYRERSLQ